MMCADPMNVGGVLKELTDADMLHIDVMDGQFVPNLMLGTEFCKALRAASDIPLDVHLMIYEPERKLSWFGIRPGDTVSVHAESTPHVHRALDMIKALGARAYVALNPGTPLSAAQPLLSEADGVLIMSVDPGFAGQKIIPSAFEKVRALRETFGGDIEVDGNVSFENALKMKEAGADVFVCGSSSVFARGASVKDNIKKLRGILK